MFPYKFILTPKGAKFLKKICESVAKKRGLRFEMLAHKISYIFENYTKGFLRELAESGGSEMKALFNYFRI